MKKTLIFLLFAFFCAGITSFASVYNYCQKIAYSLNTVPPGIKDVPNTIIKNTPEHFLLGYADLHPDYGAYRPVFRIRDRFQNEIAAYYINVFHDELEEMGGGHIYLMDISEVSESRQSFFITGFINPLYATDQYPPSMAFIAEVEMMTGTIRQAAILSDGANVIPYSILMNEDENHVLIAGELVEDNLFDPMSPTAAAGYNIIGNPSRRGVVICTDIGDISNKIWSIQGGNGMNNSSLFNEGSNFEKISWTPYGYCISGRMAVPNPSNPMYSHSTRAETILLDFSGNVVWQKSIMLSNSYTRAVSAYYAYAYDRIFVLFEDVYAHAFGVYAIDPATGAHGPVSEFFGFGGESNAVNLMAKDPNGETFTVGGMVHGYFGGMAPGAHPFFLKLKYNAVTEIVDVNGTSMNDFLVFEDGIDYSSPQIANYFGWDHHSFNMFDLDKRYIPDLPEEETYLFASKNSTYQSALLFKVNFDHCYCQIDMGMPIAATVTVPGSPTIEIRDWDIRLSGVSERTYANDLNGILECGDPDMEYSPLQKAASRLIEQPFNAADLVTVYDIMGRALYNGSYGQFMSHKDAYTIGTDAQVLIIFNHSTQKRTKMVIVR